MSWSRGRKRPSAANEDSVLLASKRQRIDNNNNGSIFNALLNAGATVVSKVAQLLRYEKGVSVATNTNINMSNSRWTSTLRGHAGKNDLDDSDDEVQFLGSVQRSNDKGTKRNQYYGKSSAATTTTSAGLNVTINKERKGSKEAASVILQGLKKRNPNWKSELRSAKSLARTPSPLSSSRSSFTFFTKPNLSQRLKAKESYSVASPNTNRHRRRRAFEDCFRESDLKMYETIVNEYQNKEREEQLHLTKRYGKTYSRARLFSPLARNLSSSKVVTKEKFLLSSETSSRVQGRNETRTDEEKEKEKETPEVINLADEDDDVPKSTKTSWSTSKFKDEYKNVFKTPTLARPKAKSVDDDIIEILEIYSPLKKSDDDRQEKNQGARPRFNSLKAEHSLHPVTSVDFLQTLRNKYVVSEKETDMKLKSEKVKLDEAKKRTKELEEALEERMRTHLSITQIDLEQRVPVEEEPCVIEEELPQITEEMEQIINKALNSRGNQVLVDAFNIEIGRKDIDTLKGLNWLNDEVINFYMQLIVDRSKAQGENNNQKRKVEWPSVHAFNTFFYPKLLQSGYNSIRRWTKKVDIFAHDLILVPVHLGMHWCLATIDNRDKCVYYYDSMGGLNERCVSALVAYLSNEHKDKKKTELKTVYKTEIVKEIPHQQNGSDCGMFACKFAEYLSRDAEITFGQEDMPYFRRRMIYEIVNKDLMHP